MLGDESEQQEEDTRVLHGPGLGPQPMGRAGPGFNDILRAGPVQACNLQARAGPGLVNYHFADFGPGLGLTFLGLGRARAYSESHSCFNIMVKYYPHLSIAKRPLFPSNASQWLQDKPASL